MRRWQCGCGGAEPAAAGPGCDHGVPCPSPAAETFCRKTRVCALHLRKYNDALLINDTVRMIDAFQCLQQFYAAERDTKDPTEQFLMAAFEGNGGVWGRLVPAAFWGAGTPCDTPLARTENRTSLQALARDRRYENPRLGKLEEILREHFQPLGTSRGIVFTKTRQSAHGLLSWLQDTAALRGQHIRAAVLTGAGYSNQTRHMTQVSGGWEGAVPLSAQFVGAAGAGRGSEPYAAEASPLLPPQNEQQDVIKLFREGALNLLFSTSVAEEGLDIPECNIVVRYGLMTNEIAMMQVAVGAPSGRSARMPQSQRGGTRGGSHIPRARWQLPGDEPSPRQSVSLGRHSGVQGGDPSSRGGTERCGGVAMSLLC